LLAAPGIERKARADIEVVGEFLQAAEPLGRLQQVFLLLGLLEVDQGADGGVVGVPGSDQLFDRNIPEPPALEQGTGGFGRGQPPHLGKVAGRVIPRGGLVGRRGLP
jgi:hypothetical protein